jgi:hypothetical protein
MDEGLPKQKRSTGRGVLMGVVIGAVVGAVVFIVKIATLNHSNYSAHWEWAITIVIGAIAGAAIGLVASGLGKDDQD